MNIAASILSANFMHLHEEVQSVIEAGADMIHFDVMDNHYVPNLSFGACLCQSLHHHFPKLIIDVHLMATPVDNLIIEFAYAGAQRISIHPDATIHLDRSLRLIKEQGVKAGLALNPATSPTCLDFCIGNLDFVLIMMVNPGFPGQKAIPAVVDKIKLVKKTFPNLTIAVDGGVCLENISSLAKAGATEFIAGNYIFSSDNYAKAIIDMRKLL